ncbi:MAG: class I SAM-dependent methyltransferase [Planctomycetota bacterium]
MENLQANVYDYPEYYDLVYGSDWKAEFDFLRGSFQRYAEAPVVRVFEPACGTGRLLYRLGKAGFDVSGLDLNPRAVEYCNERLARHGLRPAAWVGDMTDFQLPQPVDAAFNMINSFRHLLDETSAYRHLDMMASGLRPGGLYVLGFHLMPTRGKPTDEECWSARRGHLVVNTRLWTRKRDVTLRAEHCGMTYDVHTPTRHLRLKDEIQFRTYTWPQFRQLVEKVASFEIAAIHDFSYNLREQTSINGATEDVVFVLKKN